MIKKIKAIYECGIIRPLEPLKLPEGTWLNVIVTAEERFRPHENTSKILSEIAALPLEGELNSFSGRAYDSTLYPKKPIT